MATSSLVSTAEQEDIFKNLQANIKLVSDQIKNGERKKEDSSDFNKELYWNNVAAIFKVLSTETTKISLAFSKQPFPSNKNTEAMVNELEKSMLALLSIYYSLPISQGSVLRCHFQHAVIQILDSLQKFTLALSDCVNSDGQKHRLQWTGGVWQAADFVLLKDNKSCALKDLKETSGLVQDALGEIDEASENEGRVDDFEMEIETSNADVWSEQDKEVVTAASGVVKTVKSVLKKSRDAVTKHGACDSVEGIAALDELIGLTSGVSRMVDDFVCGVYAPVNYSALTQNGKVLSEGTSNILKFLRDSSLTNDEDVKWLDFLSLANTHNLDKLRDSTLPSQEHG